MWPTFPVKIVPILWFHLIQGTLFATLAVTLAGQVSNNIYRTAVYGDSSGSSLQLRCGEPDSQVEHTVSWYKNNIKISEGFSLLADGTVGKLIDFSRYSIDVEYNLTISPFYWHTTQQDGGNYECRVIDSNDATGFIYRSGVIAVVIYVIPSIAYPMCVYQGGPFLNRGDMFKYFEGDHFNLLCQSQPGIPPISLLWFQTNNSTPLSIVTQPQTSLNDTPNFSNQLELDLEVKDNETSFSCRLLQANEQDRFCTFGPVTVYKQSNVRIDPEEIIVYSPDQVVKFTCSSTETTSNQIQGYRWYIENTLNFSNDSHLDVNYLDMNKSIEIAVSETIRGNIFIVCEVDYGFSSRKTTARLYAGGYANPPSTVKDQGQVSTNNNEGIASLRTTASDSQTESDSSKSIIAPAVGGAGALIVICAIVATTACVIKLKTSKQTTESPAVNLNEYSEMNINSLKQETDPTLYSRENIAYEGCSDQTSYSRVNAAYESFHDNIQKKSTPNEYETV